MTFNMVSKCSDEILCVLSEKCPEISEVNISISDLVTDKGLKALAKGCPKLENLGIYKCWIITAEGIEYVLRFSKNLKKLKCDQLGAVLINEFSESKNTFKLTHFEQTLVRHSFVQYILFPLNIYFSKFIRIRSENFNGYLLMFHLPRTILYII